MKPFNHIDAKTVNDAVKLKSQGKTRVIAGGTDLLAVLKDGILPDYPETIVNIKTIPKLDYIKEDAGGLKIGALAKLEDIASSPLVREKYKILAEAAEAVATPQVREMGTIGGNLCQDVRCWYYRSPNVIGGYINCYLKGGKECFALNRENQFHSIFGGLRAATTPCQQACPGHVTIANYFNEIRGGNIAEAARSLLENNPIPSITGRVCPHFCEQNCNRGSFDESLSVRNIERYLGDYILDHADEVISKPKRNTGKKVAIVGSGPAGLSAAYYLRMAGNSVTVFERMQEAGGLLMYVIPAYRLPKDIVRRVVKMIENTGVEFKLNTEIGKDVTLDSLKKSYDAVFVGSGAWSPVSIGLDGEESALFVLDFLTNIQKGIKKAPGKKIVVIGGGNAAIDVAISTLRLGTEEATMVCLESREQMPALPWEIEQALEEHVKLMPSWGPHKVLKKNGKVTGLELIRCTSVYDKAGRFSPAYDENTKTTVECDAVIMAVGYSADLKFAQGVVNTSRGLIVADHETQATSKPGIFAGGGVAHGAATVIDAIASGKRAAVALDASLKKPGAAGEIEKESDSLLKFNNEYLKPTTKLQKTGLAVRNRKIDLEDVSTASLSEINDEAQRCFNCGCVSINATDTGVVLEALNAKVKIVGAKGTRTVPIDEFFGAFRNNLEEGDIVTEIQVPPVRKGVKQAFIKFRERESVDFALASVASIITEEKGVCTDARIILGAVAPIPVRAGRAEQILVGQKVNVKIAGEAAEAALEGAIPLGKNDYKIPIVREIVERAILAADSQGK